MVVRSEVIFYVLKLQMEVGLDLLSSQHFWKSYRNLRYNKESQQVFKPSRPTFSQQAISSVTYLVVNNNIKTCYKFGLNVINKVALEVFLCRPYNKCSEQPKGQSIRPQKSIVRKLDIGLANSHIGTTKQLLLRPPPSPSCAFTNQSTIRTCVIRKLCCHSLSVMVSRVPMSSVHNKYMLSTCQIDIGLSSNRLPMELRTFPKVHMQLPDGVKCMCPYPKRLTAKRQAYLSRVS